MQACGPLTNIPSDQQWSLEGNPLQVPIGFKLVPKDHPDMCANVYGNYKGPAELLVC